MYHYFMALVFYKIICILKAGFLYAATISKQSLEFLFFSKSKRDEVRILCRDLGEKNRSLETRLIFTVS